MPHASGEVLGRQLFRFALEIEVRQDPPLSGIPLPLVSLVLFNLAIDGKHGCDLVALPVDDAHQTDTRSIGPMFASARPGRPVCGTWALRSTMPLEIAEKVRATSPLAAGVAVAQAQCRPTFSGVSGDPHQSLTQGATHSKAVVRSAGL